MKLHTPVSLTAIACACCVCFLSACGGSAGSGQTTPNSAGTPPPPPPPPDPDAPTRHTVHGEVFSFETGVIPNADVNLFFWTGNSGFSYWYVQHPLRTDGLGQFEAEQLPDSYFNVLAFRDGFVQPCAYFAQMDGEDIEARVEMIPVASLNAVDPPRPQLSFEPSATGSIFENTPNGRVAVAGAALWAEDGIGVGLATTASDLAGGFYMCNLPANTMIYVGKEGFEPKWIGPIDATEPVVLEVALEREIP